MTTRVSVHNIEFSEADDQLLHAAERNALTPSRWLSGYDLANVAVTDPWLVNAGQKEITYLLSFDVDRLLVEFRKQAGLPTNGVKNYGGWESGEDETTNLPDASAQDGPDHPHRFTGHFVGHWLTACCQACRSRLANDEQRRELGERIDAFVAGLREAQLAYARRDPDNAGFLPAFAVTALPGGNDGLMVPFYNLHKVLQGLIVTYRIGPSDRSQRTALAAASDFALFILRWVNAHKDAGLLTIEYGGMNDALYQLFEITGDPRHARAAHLFDEVPLFRSIARGKDVLPGLHANATIPKFIGALQRVVAYATHPAALAALSEADRADLTAVYLRAAVRFWEIVSVHHTYANGDNSGCEHFHDPDHLFTDAAGGDEMPNACSSETCNAYNMLKLTRMLLGITASPRLADWYGTTFRSAILPSQNPVTGMSTYYQAMKAGYSKVFGRPFGEFWCCQGTGLENFTKLGDSLWFARTRGGGDADDGAGIHGNDGNRKNDGVHGNDGHKSDGGRERDIYAAGLVSSRLVDPESRLVLTVNAHIPQSEHVTITVDEAPDASASAETAEDETAPRSAAPPSSSQTSQDIRRGIPAVLKLHVPEWADAGAVRLTVEGPEVPMQPERSAQSKVPAAPSRAPAQSKIPALSSQGSGSSRDAEGWISVPIAAGTVARFDIPARLQIVRDAENPDWVAFRDGPVLLSADLGERAGGGDPEDADDAHNSVMMGILTRCAKYRAAANAKAVLRVEGMDPEDWASHPDRALERISAGEVAGGPAAVLEATDGTQDAHGAQGAARAPDAQSAQDRHAQDTPSAHEAQAGTAASDRTSDRLKADGNPRHLVFRFRNVSGPAADLVLRPHYLQYRDAYAIYFLLDRGE